MATVGLVAARVRFAEPVDRSLRTQIPGRVACGREYPTRAYKCAEPDCWEYVFMEEFCDTHKPKDVTG